MIDKFQEDNVLMGPNNNNEESLKAALEDLLTKIKEQEDPGQMDYYKKMIKRHTPFTMRRYLCAFLLKKYLEGNKSSVSSHNKVSLFFSIGKSRRIFAKDMQKLIVNEARVPESAILGIKALENYSFVDVDKKYAEKIIVALNGFEVKGRGLAVNYARKK